MDAHSVNENRTKYGRIITCEWFNTPLFDENGNFAGAVSLAQDVTERERTAREVESSRRRLRALNAALENAVEGIARLDTDGTYVSANHAYAAMFGYQPEELLGRPWHQTVYYDDVKKLADAHLRMLSNRRVELEVRGRRKDGSVFWKHVVVLKAKDEKGEWTGSYCFTDDITQRKFAEEVLQAYAHRLHDISHRVVANQEAERRHLAQELHDEVGQVLSAISVNLQSIAPICDASAQSRLHESVQIVNQAIQQVRSLSFDLSPAMLDTLGLVATLRWCANRQAQRTGFTLHFNAYCSGHRRPSAADIACYRVAQESLTNIVRHAKAKNVWVVFSESEDEYIELVVRDDGVGFDVAQLCRRVARGASFGVQGMQERVELMGGEFAIDSTPNGGTSVTARFPARPRITDEFPMGGTGDETNSGAVGRRP
jgi:PAS domain S-box-containing protein